MVFELTQAGLGQAALDVILTHTLSPLDKDEDEKTGEFVPTVLPFRYHWNDGLFPPPVNDAVKTTG
jgi:hypothetical protein